MVLLIEMSNTCIWLMCWEPGPRAWDRVHSTQYQHITRTGPQKDSSELLPAHQSTQANWPVVGWVELHHEGPKAGCPIMAREKGGPDNFLSSQPAQ